MRNNRNVWRAVATVLSVCALVASAPAASITESATAPSANILTSQLTDLGPGVQDNGRDYTDNVGPPGQTFTVSSANTLGAITIMGRGDSAGVWTSGGNQPFTGTEIWTIAIGSVNGNGSVNVLDTEVATGFVGPANIADFLTFSLSNPVALTPGVTYGFDIAMGGGPWFGLAHSTGDAYAGGTAFNAIGGSVVPNPNNYDYVFAAQGVPEPNVLALIGLGGVGLVAAHKRRRA